MKKLLVIGNDPIEGLGIINKDSNNNFQIVYLDASNMSVLEDLIRFAVNLIHREDATYDRIQIFSPQRKYVSTVMEQVGSERSEQFLLYKRVLQY